MSGVDKSSLGLNTAKKQVPRNVPQLSLAALAEQQTQSSDFQKVDRNRSGVLKEKCSNVPDRVYDESSLASNLSKLTLSVSKQRPLEHIDSVRKPLGLTDNLKTSKQPPIKPVRIGVPTKPTSFSLAELAKEHNSSPPGSSSWVFSTSPRQQNTNPQMSGLSLAQLAQQQTGSPPTGSMSNLKKHSKHSKSTDSSLANSAKHHSKQSNIMAANVDTQSSDSSINMAALEYQQWNVTKGDLGSSSKSSVSNSPQGNPYDHPPKVKETIASHQATKGFSLSALAAKHEEKITTVAQSAPPRDHRTQLIQDVKERNSERKLLPPPGFKPKQTIDLSALAAQHKLPEQHHTDQVTALKLPPKLLKEVLTTKPSIFGQTLCCNYSQVSPPVKLHGSKNLFYPKFSFVRQMSHSSNSPVIDVNPLVPFDFSTPSPDDIVLRKQEGAFTRTGNYITFGRSHISLILTTKQLISLMRRI